ncbi:hypothetical protein J1614_001749 [Plenodomus biglobosus]|nr:hypothetical protein J1614_001749 [Plenodomus biglobosus]
MSSNAKPLRLSAAVQDPTLAVVEVGAEKKKYYIHRQFLMAHSEFFAKALSGPWREAQEGVVKLDDVDCEPFELFIDWLYTGVFEWAEPDCEHTKYCTCPGDYQVNVLKAMVLGDRIRTVSFRNATQIALVDYYINAGVTYRYPAIIYAYAALPSDHGVRKVLVDTHCEYFSEVNNGLEGELGRRQQLPYDFLIDVAVRYSEMLGNGIGRGKRFTYCDYHDHAPEQDRERCPRYGW